MQVGQDVMKFLVGSAGFEDGIRQDLGLPPRRLEVEESHTERSTVTPSSPTPRRPPKRVIVCERCDRRGHVAAECRTAVDNLPTSRRWRPYHSRGGKGVGKGKGWGGKGKGYPPGQYPWSTNSWNGNPMGAALAGGGLVNVFLGGMGY